MNRTLSRKDFLLMMGGGVLLAVGCGDDDTGSGSPTGADPTSSASGSGPSGSSASGAGASGSTHSTSTTGSGGGTGGSDPAGTGGTGGGGASMCTAMVVAAISNNHGHALELSLADIDAGAEKTYSIQAGATHCHQVIITAADFATLKSGGVVTKKTCNGGNHELVLSCVAGAPAPGAPDCDAEPMLGVCQA